MRIRTPAGREGFADSFDVWGRATEDWNTNRFAAIVVREAHHEHLGQVLDYIALSAAGWAVVAAFVFAA